MSNETRVPKKSQQGEPNVASSGLGRVVSSAHLAAGNSPALSEFEFGLILLSHAFYRWITRCADAAGFPDLSPLDVLVLHTVNHRDKKKRLADICLVLNVEDTHTVNYALKKLERLSLVKAEKIGKEKVIGVTTKGGVSCRKYYEIRETLLVATVKSIG